MSSRDMTLYCRNTCALFGLSDITVHYINCALKTFGDDVWDVQTAVHDERGELLGALRGICLEFDWKNRK